MALGDRRRTAGVAAEQLGELGPELVGGPRGAELRLELDAARGRASRGRTGRRTRRSGRARSVRGRAGRGGRARPGRARSSGHRAAPQAQVVHPVVGRRHAGRVPAVARRPAVARTPRRLDEAAELAGVLAAGARRGLDAGGHVDAPRPDPPDRLPDVVTVEPAREQQPDPAGDGSASDQSNTCPIPGSANRRGRCRPDRCPPWRPPGRPPRTPGSRTGPLADPAHVGQRLAPVELRAAQPDRVDDLDDPLLALVAEHAHGDHKQETGCFFSSECTQQFLKGFAAGAAAGLSVEFLEAMFYLILQAGISMATTTFA